VKAPGVVRLFEGNVPVATFNVRQKEQANDADPLIYLRHFLILASTLFVYRQHHPLTLSLQMNAKKKKEEENEFSPCFAQSKRN
jgi:hypothetical protein